MADFKVQRGYTIIADGNTTATITAGVDYTAPTGPAFIRIIAAEGKSGIGQTSGGGQQYADDITVYISNPANLGTSITFTRVGSANNCRLSWEIIEYIGSNGGANEFKVREAGTVSFSTIELTKDTGAISGIVDDADVVVFITGQSSDDTDQYDFDAIQCTAEWLSATDVARFIRGSSGGGTVGLDLSYVVVEFTGSNWTVQRVEHQYSAAGSWETESITTVGALARTFLHIQKRLNITTGNPGLDEFGHEVYLYTTSSIRFQLESGADNPGNHYSVCWVIENSQTDGTPMDVTRIAGTRGDGEGSEEDTWTETISISATDEASVMGESNRSGGTGTAFPRGMNSLQISSTTAVELKRSDNGQNQTYRFEVVEWPTVAAGAAGVPRHMDYYRRRRVA